MDQKQVLAEIETLLALIEQIQHQPEEDEVMEANAVMLMQAMDRLDRLQDLMAIPCAFNAERRVKSGKPPVHI